MAVVQDLGTRAILVGPPAGSHWRILVPGSARYIETIGAGTTAGMLCCTVDRLSRMTCYRLSGVSPRSIQVGSRMVHVVSSDGQRVYWLAGPGGPGSDSLGRYSLWCAPWDGGASSKLWSFDSRRDGLCRGMAARPGVVYLMLCGIGGHVRSALWAIPTHGGNPHCLAAGPGYWAGPGASDSDIVWTTYASLSARRTGPALALALLSGRDGSVTTWRLPTSQTLLYSSGARHGRWFTFAVQGSLVPRVGTAIGSLRSADLDGRSERAVLASSGSGPATISQFVPDPGGACDYAVEAGVGGPALCRIVANQGPERLKKICALSQAWKWEVRGLDSRYGYLLATPDKEDRLTAWVLRLLHRPRQPALCRVPLPERPTPGVL